MTEPSAWEAPSRALRRSAPYRRLVEELGEAVRLPVPAAAWVTELLGADLDRPLLVVVPHEVNAYAWLEAARLFSTRPGADDAVYFPAPSLSPYQETEISLLVRAEESLAVGRIARGEVTRVITTPRALFRRLPRGVAVAVAMLIVLVALGVLASFVASSIGRFEERAAVYQERLVQLGERVTVFLNAHDIEFGQDTLVDAIEDLPLQEMATKAVGGVLNFVGNAVLTLIFMLYLVAGRKPTGERPGIWGEIDRSVQRYIVTKIHTSVATGVVVGVVLWLFGLEFALVFGILTVLLFFIPTVGSIIATLVVLSILGWGYYTTRGPKTGAPEGCPMAADRSA